MENQKNSNLFLDVCNFLIDAAPRLDMTTRSNAGWGEPDYPCEEDYN